MTKVRVEPLGVEFEVFPDETLMQAANRSGLYWPTVCGGNGYCNRCFIVTDPADPAFGPMGAEEQEALRRVRWRISQTVGERLACQVTILADVSVRKKGVAALSGAEARTIGPVPDSRAAQVDGD